MDFAISNSPISWSIYLENIEHCYEAMMEDYGRYSTIDISKKSKVSPLPTTSAQAPPYAKVSPTVLKHDESASHHSKKKKKKKTKSKSYKPSSPKAVDSHGNPDPDDSSSSSLSSSSSSLSVSNKRHKERSKKSKGSKNSEVNSQGIYYEDMPGLDYDNYINCREKSFDGKQVENERALRWKAHKQRPQFNTVKWDGLSSTFRQFKRAIEGHLIQVGAGYMIQSTFVVNYQEHGFPYLSSLVFWDMYKQSCHQAPWDREYLYGMLVTATMKIQHKTLIEYEHNMDGILAWQELCREYENDGSKELRLEQLEALATTPFSDKVSGGMATYIDKLQTYLAELETITPADYGDCRKKRMLLSGVRTAPGMMYLIQKCRDNNFMSYDSCAAYLRSNSMIVDAHSRKQAPSRLMMAETYEEEPPGHTLESVSKLFHTMASEGGLDHTYCIFNTRAFREPMGIPSSIWAELEPAIKERINEINLPNCSVKV